MSQAAPASPNRKIVIILAIAGGVLLIVVVALVFLLIGRGLGGGANPTAAIDQTSNSPSAPAPAPAQQSNTPAPTTHSTPAPKPVDHSTRFTYFHAVTQVKCVQGSDTKPVITVSWASANAVSAWYTANDGDAANDMYMQIPLTGNQNDFTDEHLFDCFHRPSQAYTLTLVAPNGQHISEHWTVTNVGDQ
ncbi:MAG TPA: hypothetical protein VHX87_02515 [Galbitalea sp.]|jgi:hypothetical protein|nr:hypothetical protein [Galbitalea sp.]